MSGKDPNFVVPARRIRHETQSQWCFVKQRVIFFIRFLAVRLNNDLKGHRGLWNEAEQKIEAQEKKQEPSSYTSMLAHS